MRRKGRLPELLCPAGNMECLYAAVAAGADAVYVGGVRFGARAYARNFDIDELTRAVSYCHLRGVKLYVTLNTLIEDVEMRDALEYAVSLYRIGVDALIVADLGVVREIRKLLPDFELHASTQMSVHNTRGAEEAARMGCSRVVPARELSKSDISSLVDGSSVEVEVFLHGALCVCHSGQCLFSSLVGGRSGNRGECAQPCRLPYGDGYPLSLCDLSLAEHIPSLIESGVASLKIEGRMKSAAYVYAVTSVYRRLLDEGRCANAEERELLRRAFSRGGFTDGYYTGRLTSGMTGVRSEEDKRDSRETDTREFGMIRTPVSASATLRLGEPSRLTLSLESGRSVTVTGDAPAVATSSPLTEESVRDRLSKMGNTMLSLDRNDITLELDSGINMSPAALNSLRRSAVEALESAARVTVPDVDLSLYSVGDRRDGMRAECAARVSAEFLSPDAYREARELSPETVSRIGAAFLPLMPYSDGVTQSGAVSLPIVIFDSEIDAVRDALKHAYDAGVRLALIHNVGAISLVREAGMTPVASYRLNVTNGYSAAALREAGVEKIISSPELTLPKARDVGGSVITLGRIPLMITERCFIKENFGCESCGKSSLVDRRGEAFPMLREWEHRNVIVNSQLTYMGDKRDELARYRIGGEHMIFTVESGREICELIDGYFEGERLPARYGSGRRIGRRSVTSEPARTPDRSAVFATRDGAKPAHKSRKSTPSAKVHSGAPSGRTSDASGVREKRRGVKKRRGK